MLLQYLYQMMYLHARHQCRHELLAITEEVKGTVFGVQFDAVEKLQKNQVTESPGVQEMYSFFPKQCSSFL